MGLIQEFKDFALKGNLVDMAVGIVIGTASAAIVKSFMDNIVSPLVGVIAGVPDMSSLKIPLGKEIANAKGEMEQAAIQYGAFIQSFLDFLILAFAVFVGIKVMNSFLTKAEKAAGPSAEVKLLTEIRDSLKK